MRQQLLFTHILLSATLILAACGSEHNQTAEAGSVPAAKTEFAVNIAAALAPTKECCWTDMSQRDQIEN